MNLERLPEIVDAVKPNDGLMVLCCDPQSKYSWRDRNGITRGLSSPHDAANACVVAMLERGTNHCMVSLSARGLAILERGFSVSRTFHGDLLNALYDAFRTHPEWFAALDADERGGK